MKKVVVQPGQTAFDIALQYYGHIEGVQYLMEDNVFDGEMVFGNINLEGKTLEIREDVVINQSVVDYFKKTIVTY